MTTATIKTVSGTISKFEVQYAIDGLRARGSLTRDYAERLTRKLEGVKPSDFGSLALVFSDTLLVLKPADEASKNLLASGSEMVFTTIHGSEERFTGVSEALRVFNDAL